MNTIQEVILKRHISAAYKFYSTNCKFEYGDESSTRIDVCKSHYLTAGRFRLPDGTLYYDIYVHCNMFFKQSLPIPTYTIVHSTHSDRIISDIAKQTRDLRMWKGLDI